MTTYVPSIRHVINACILCLLCLAAGLGALALQALLRPDDPARFAAPAAEPGDGAPPSLSDNNRTIRWQPGEGGGRAVVHGDRFTGIDKSYVEFTINRLPPGTAVAAGITVPASGETKLWHSADGFVSRGGNPLPQEGRPAIRRFAEGDVIGIAVDPDQGKVWWTKATDGVCSLIWNVDGDMKGDEPGLGLKSAYFYDAPAAAGIVVELTAAAGHPKDADVVKLTLNAGRSPFLCRPPLYEAVFDKPTSDLKISPLPPE